jgi:hypothetical protein
LQFISIAGKIARIREDPLNWLAKYLIQLAVDVNQSSFYTQNPVKSLHGLFTSRGCCSGKEVAHEAVVNYREWAATKPM